MSFSICWTSFDDRPLTWLKTMIHPLQKPPRRLSRLLMPKSHTRWISYHYPNELHAPWRLNNWAWHESHSTVFISVASTTSKKRLQSSPHNERTHDAQMCWCSQVWNLTKVVRSLKDSRGREAVLGSGVRILEVLPIDLPIEFKQRWLRDLNKRSQCLPSLYN